MNQRLALVLVVLMAAAGTAQATTPPVVYDNPNTYPLGSRAAAMAGAYTALACDEAAVHYNPAALACASATRLELSASAYVLQGLAIPDALGLGEDVSAVDYHSSPAIVGGARILDEGDRETGVGRWVWGLSVTIPHSLSLRIEPVDPTRPTGLTFAARDTVVAGDLGMGYQLTPTLALGLALGGGVRSYDAHQTEVLGATASDCPEGGCTQFVSLAQEFQSSAVGLRGKLGLRYTPLPELSVGLCLVSPTLHVWGSYSESNTTTYALLDDDGAGGQRVFYDQLVERVRGTSELALPGKVALGVAWSTPGVVLSLDASLHFPRRVVLARDLRALPVMGMAPPEDLSDRVLERRVHPNFALGAEVHVAEGFVLNGGLYTDLSAVSDADFASGASDRVDMFGATFALGIVGKVTRSWLGIAGAWGQGSANVPSVERTLEQALQGGLADDRIATMTRWTVAAFLGSSYSFVSDE